MTVFNFTAGLIAAWFLADATTVGLLRAAEPVTAAPPQLSALGTNAAAQEIVVQGHVVCLAEAMHKRHGANLPTRHPHLWGLQATNGHFYTLLRSRYSEAIFADERVRSKDLLLRARLFPQSNLLEILNLKTVRAGQVHELFYYCVICHIFMVAPEICECCQGPTELVEKPAPD